MCDFHISYIFFGVTRMKKDIHPAEQFREQVEPVIISKIEEFQLLGYDKVTPNEIWDCLMKKKWKNMKEEMKLYQVVNDILSLKIGEYMTYATIEAYKSPDWFGDEGKDALKELL
jgi:hypothetical protein